MDALVCPKGHYSTELDYCSECGAKLAEAAIPPADIPPAAGTVGPPIAAIELCPACGASRDNSGIAFCEICGYDFAAPPPLSPASSARPADSGLIPSWTVIISVDPTLRAAESPEPPPSLPPVTVSLKVPVNLIGRRSEARAIFPEIAIPHDDAISHRHALLQLDDRGVLSLRDIGSANGTRLNGKEIAPMADYALKDGDEITAGHWTRISVRGIV
jgi:ribosomal protein L37AE/L43A